MFKQIGIVLLASGILVGTSPSAAQANTESWNTLDRQWQMEMLFEPASGQLKREQRGGINIYSDLKDSDVERVMDEQYDRIENMMFVRTISTDADGEVLMTTSPEGEQVVVVEEDGC